MTIEENIERLVIAHARLGYAKTPSELAAERKARRVLHWLALQLQGSSGPSAARLVGVPLPTLHRWRVKLATGAVAALVPQTHRSGRRKKGDSL
jgi:hypothetical protein